MIQECPRILTVQDALDIPQESCPMVVLSDNLKSWISRRIKAHTKGRYNHAMILWWPGVVVTQGLKFEAAHLADYLNGGYRVKFWYNPTLKNWQKHMGLQKICEDIRDRRGYDALGIVGQWLASVLHWASLRKINIPWRHYCSEEAGDVIREMDPTFTELHPSPAFIDQWMKESATWQVYGVYIDPDTL
jgi:hypothetical protein